MTALPFHTWPQFAFLHLLEGGEPSWGIPQSYRNWPNGKRASGAQERVMGIKAHQRQGGGGQGWAAPSHPKLEYLCQGGNVQPRGREVSGLPGIITRALPCGLMG